MENVVNIRNEFGVVNEIVILIPILIPAVIFLWIPIIRE